MNERAAETIMKKYLAIATLIFTACGSSGGGSGRVVIAPANTTTPTATTTVGTTFIPVKFTTIEQGDQSGHLTPLNAQEGLAITTETQWMNFWNEHGSRRFPAPKRPFVDFNTEMVFTVFDKEQTNGGYRVDIVSVDDDNLGNRVVSYRPVAPAPNTPLPSVITQPYHFVRASKTSRKVIFRQQSLYTYTNIGGLGGLTELFNVDLATGSFDYFRDVIRSPGSNKKFANRLTAGQLDTLKQVLTAADLANQPLKFPRPFIIFDIPTLTIGLAGPTQTTEREILGGTQAPAEVNDLVDSSRTLINDLIQTFQP
jgi:hypothetical protein